MEADEAEEEAAEAETTAHCSRISVWMQSPVRLDPSRQHTTIAAATAAASSTAAPLAITLSITCTAAAAAAAAAATSIPTTSAASSIVAAALISSQLEPLPPQVKPETYVPAILDDFAAVLAHRGGRRDGLPQRGLRLCAEKLRQLASLKGVQRYWQTKTCAPCRRPPPGPL